MLSDEREKEGRQGSQLSSFELSFPFKDKGRSLFVVHDLMTFWGGRRDRVYRERRGGKKKGGRRCPSTAVADSRRKCISLLPSSSPPHFLPRSPQRIPIQPLGRIEGKVVSNLVAPSEFSGAREDQSKTRKGSTTRRARGRVEKREREVKVLPLFQVRFVEEQVWLPGNGEEDGFSAMKEKGWEGRGPSAGEQRKRETRRRSDFGGSPSFPSFAQRLSRLSGVDRKPDRTSGAGIG